jgi:hypothetical protein
MALITESKLLSDVALQNRVTMAIIHSGYSVIAEDPATPNHANRVALAKSAMQDPTGFTRSFYPFVVVQPGIVENGADSSLIDDSVIMSAVASLWDTIATLNSPQIPSLTAPILTPPPISFPQQV